MLYLQKDTNKNSVKASNFINYTVQTDDIARCITQTSLQKVPLMVNRAWSTAQKPLMHATNAFNKAVSLETFIACVITRLIKQTKPNLYQIESFSEWFNGNFKMIFIWESKLSRSWKDFVGLESCANLFGSHYSCFWNILRSKHNWFKGAQVDLNYVHIVNDEINSLANLWVSSVRKIRKARITKKQ